MNTVFQFTSPGPARGHQAVSVALMRDEQTVHMTYTTDGSERNTVGEDTDASLDAVLRLLALHELTTDAETTDRLRRWVSAEGPAPGPNGTIGWILDGLRRDYTGEPCPLIVCNNCVTSDDLAQAEDIENLTDGDEPELSCDECGAAIHGPHARAFHASKGK